MTSHSQEGSKVVQSLVPVNAAPGKASRMWKSGGPRRLLCWVVAPAIGFSLAAGAAWAHYEQPARTLTVDPGWEPTAEDRALLTDAAEILVSKCMAERGLTYVAERSDPETFKELDFDYVVDDVGWARRNGYRSLNPHWLEKVRADDPNKKHTAALDDSQLGAYKHALLGAGRGGLEVVLPNGMRRTASDQSCVSKADEILYGDLKRWFRMDRTASNLPDSYRTQVIADPRYASAAARWAECMRTKGFDYRTPKQIRDELPELLGERTPEAARQLETRVASAEAQCASTSGLGAIARQLDREYREPIHRPYQKFVEGKREMQRAALDRARRIVRATA